MSSNTDRHAPKEIIDTERTAYLEHLPDPKPDWPADVRVVYQKLQTCLFDWGELKAEDVIDDCGIGGHDIYSRFRHVTGHGIKEFVVHHRVQLAKKLLRYEVLSVSEVAFAVGYSSPSGFTKTFKRHVGQSPTSFREQGEE